MVPSAIADTAMPISTPGSGTPATPRAPANAITRGNTTGSSQIAGAPRNAPHSPTATIAITWSGPKIGWVNPPMKSMATPFSEWAKAGDAAAANATGSTQPIALIAVGPNEALMSMHAPCLVRCEPRLKIVTGHLRRKHYACLRSERHLKLSDELVGFGS